MTKIIIGTTPTIRYNFKVVSPSDFTSAILTVKQSGAIIIQKELADAAIESNSISWTFTQEDTLLIGVNTAKMMLNWVTSDGTRGASEEVVIHCTGNHIQEVI